MATVDTIKISDGTTDISLIMDTDGFEMLAGGGNFGISSHSNLYHKSDWQDGEMLVRESSENKAWSFKLAIRGTTDDAIINTIRDFNKMIRQARQYHINRDVDKVYLYIKLEGATNATYYDIIDIQPKGLGLLNYINRNIGEVIFDDGLAIDIITEPSGYGDVVVLENELPNAHFETDTNADGLANAWTKVGSPATTLPTDVKFVGSQSQKVVTSDDSSTEGVVADTIACTAYQGEDVAVFAWISVSGDTVHFRVNGNVSGELDSVRTDGVGTAVLNTKTVDGTVWIKIGFVGTVGASDTTLAFTVERQSGSATQVTTFYVDACYLQWANSLPGAGWMSYKQLINHHDDTFGDINYIDVADISGDIEAKTRITIISNTGAAVTSPTIWIGKRVKDNVYHRATLDSTEEDSTPTSTTPDADYSFGEYSHYTVASATPGVWSEFMYWNFSQPVNALDFNGKFMLILVGGSYDDDVYFKARYEFQYLTEVVETEPVLGSGRDILEIGILDLPPGFKDTSGNLYSFSINLLANNGTGSNADWTVDYLLLMPLSNYRIIRQSSFALVNDTGYADDGIVTGSIYGLNTPGDAYRDTSMMYGLGEQITLDPIKTERLTFLWMGNNGSSSAYNPQQKHYIRLEYQPRTEFLIGT